MAVERTLGVYLRNETRDSGRSIMFATPIVVFGGISAAISGYWSVYRVR